MFKSMLAVFIALALMSEVLAAEKLQGWQFMGEFESGAVQYVDINSLKKEHGYIRVRTLVDYKTPVWSITSEKILSETGTDYIDCNGRRFAILEAASYECQMAKCSPKENYRYPFDEVSFKPILSGDSQVSNIFNLVCQ